MKIAVNRCWGGFGLSPLAIREYLHLKGKQCFFYKRNYSTEIMTKVPVEEASTYDITLTKDYGPSLKEVWSKFEDDYFYYRDTDRNDPDLIKVIETLGSEAASGSSSQLEIVEIPDDVRWEIHDYDGMESVHEQHRSW